MRRVVELNSQIPTSLRLLLGSKSQGSGSLLPLGFDLTMPGFLLRQTIVVDIAVRDP